ncbi:MAG: hypothetical protein E6J81_13270 [Deltaproteobacteria bacterium]|nr:MAG: hypothetical protein E6J81_13270 [Deltaproteobacteria bacterium]
MRYGGVPFLVHWTDSEATVEKAQGVRASAIAEWHHGNYIGALIGGLLSSVDRTNGQGGGDVTGMRVAGIVSGNDGDLTDPDGTVVQMGWYNRAAEQSIPFLNVRGISNLFERPLRRLRGHTG